MTLTCTENEPSTNMTHTKVCSTLMALTDQSTVLQHGISLCVSNDEFDGRCHDL